MGMPHNSKLILDTTDDNRTYRILYKLIHAGCSWCPWHRGDNRRGRTGHGDRTPRYKTKHLDTWRDFLVD